MKYTILVDMDDVLVDLLAAWVTYLNREYNLNVNREDVKDWDMQKAFPSLSSAQIYNPLFKKGLWESVKPIPKSVETLQAMMNDSKLNVKICTASHFDSLKYKFNDCLLKYFPFINSKDIITCYDKSLVKAHFRIDDYPANLTDKSSIGYLIDAPYNQTCSKYRRVHDLAEAYEHIKTDIEQKERREL